MKKSTLPAPHQHGHPTGGTAKAHLPQSGTHHPTGQQLGGSHHPEQPAKKGFWSDKGVWKRSAITTFTCLAGCSIGDFGMLIFLQAFYPQTAMPLQMALAILAGLVTSVALETWLLRRREQLAWKAALNMALSMSLISIVGMELVMNATDFMITGGRLPVTEPAYWLAFLPAAAAGFLAPLPYNYYQLKKYNRSHH